MGSLGARIPPARRECLAESRKVEIITPEMWRDE
jgi:hypothetical protein